jgi:hypothetical protein
MPERTLSAANSRRETVSQRRRPSGDSGATAAYSERQRLTTPSSFVRTGALSRSRNSTKRQTTRRCFATCSPAPALPMDRSGRPAAPVHTRPASCAKSPSAVSRRCCASSTRRPAFIWSGSTSGRRCSGARFCISRSQDAGREPAQVDGRAAGLRAGRRSVPGSRRSGLVVGELNGRNRQRYARYISPWS